MRYFLRSMSYIVVTVVVCSAQSPDGFKERMRRPSERVESYKKVRMIEALKLDEETSVKLINRYNNHRKSVKQLEKERGEILDKLEVQIQSSVTDAEYQKTFNELLDTDRKITDARKKYLEELKEIFTTKQIAEYLLFERNFMKDLRNVVNDVQKERMKKD